VAPGGQTLSPPLSSTFAPFFADGAEDPLCQHVVSADFGSTYRGAHSEGWDEGPRSLGEDSAHLQIECRVRLDHPCCARERIFDAFGSCVIRIGPAGDPFRLAVNHGGLIDNAPPSADVDGAPDELHPQVNNR
jgi:hypothetical protein